ncbi:MAG: efflux RND transporter periplasmic adaptor subunit [Chromatiaceae bacterium]
MKKTFITILALLVLAVLIAGGLKLRQLRQQELAAVAPPEPSPWSVHTATVERGRATRGFPALAQVEGANEVTVAAQLGGILLEMGPREGQRVAEGEPLARIDTRELEDTLASLAAQRQGAVAEAERKARDAQRGEDLLKSRTISQSQVDQDRAAARSAEEQVHSLEKQIGAERTRIGYARIVAPFTGVISARLADPGDLATVGKPLYRLIDTRSARLEVRLPAEVLEQVAPGTEVVVSHRGQELVLRADRVFPSLDERSLGQLEIDVPELPFGLAPGALVRARVITAAVEDALLVPADTLLPAGDSLHSRVLKVVPGEPSRVHQIPVSIALRTSGGVAVAGDLSPGDRLVTAHETTLLRLHDGDPVRIEGNGR